MEKVQNVRTKSAFTPTLKAMNFDWTSLCEEDFHKLKETKNTVATQIIFVLTKTNIYVTWGKMKIKIEKERRNWERWWEFRKGKMGKGGLKFLCLLFLFLKFFIWQNFLQRSNGFKIHQKKQFYEVKILQ